MPQIDHVVCPIDLTESSTRALAYAFAWARWYSARVHVLYVAPLSVVAAPLAGVAVTFEQRSLAEIRLDVERYVATVPNPGVTVDIQVFEGDPPGFIRRQAERFRRSVIIMGSHGRRGIERFVLGSVAERVVGSAVAPTLIVPPHDAHAPGADPVCKRIVCAVDLLPSSLEGLRYAVSLAREADAELEVVHVIPEAGADVVQTTQHFRVPEYLRYRADEALQELRRHIPEEARQGCTIHERVVFGDVATSILQQARDARAELIVMGTGDHAHLRSLWLGNATSRIAHEAVCPMLIVPTPAVIKRAVALESRPVAREYWRDTFDRVSLEHQGDPATVTLLDPGFAAPEAMALPLIGITMDMPPSSDVAVILGGPGGAHLSHVIQRPTEVLLDEGFTHDTTRLLVRSADGASTLLEVTRRARTMIEAMAEARIQF